MLNWKVVLIPLAVLVVSLSIAVSIHQPPNPTVAGFPKEVDRSVPVELYYAEFREEFAAELKKLNRDHKVQNKWGLLVALVKDDQGHGLIKVAGTQLGGSDEKYLFEQVDLSQTEFPGNPRGYARICASHAFKSIVRIDAGDVEHGEKPNDQPKASIDAGAPVNRALLL